MIHRPLVLSISLLAICFVASRLEAANPTAGQIQQVVSNYFETLPDYKPGDLITQKDVKAVLAEMSNQGWQVPQAKELLNSALQDGDALAGLMSTKNGKRLMRKVASYKLVYDRMDRVARVSGGERMIRDLAKLPDGQRYLQMQTPPGVPDMLALLPKQRSGKVRSVKDYDKPTGRVYTAQALAKRILQLFNDKSQKRSTAP
jgi:hypothetical protein